jgi:uncharacterized membrane protein
LLRNHDSTHTYTYKQPDKSCLILAYILYVIMFAVLSTFIDFLIISNLSIREFEHRTSTCIINFSNGEQLAQVESFINLELT